MDTRWSSRIRCLALASFVRSASRLASQPVHEVIGGQHVPEQLGGIAFELAENFTRELVVLLAEGSHPASER